MMASEEELWRLIAERTQAGADHATIDAKIWERFGQTWAVMFTDLTGFSRMVAEFGIIHFLQEIHEQHILLFPIVAEHGGIVLKTEADSMLLIFPSAASAVTCGIAMNRCLFEVNRDRAPENKVLLCLGIGFGRMLRVGERDVFGKEVNAASKLGEDIAKAGEVLLTQAARDAVDPQLPVELLDVRVAGSEKNYRVLYPSE